MWRSSLVFLGLLTALFTAVYKSLDNLIVHNFITAPDGLTAAFSYLVVGGWTGVLAGIVFSLFLGRRLIDPAFGGVVFRNRKMHTRAFIAGGISAGSTLFLLWGNQFGDPSVLVALSTAAIAYTVFYDVLARMAKLGKIIVPASLVVLGSMLAAFSGSLEVTLTGIFFVLVVSNGLTAISEIAEQGGTQASDGVNFFIWRFVWLATAGTILALAVSAVRGYLPMLFETITVAISHLPWIILTMFFVFLGIGMKLTLKKANAVSVILLLLSAQVIIAYPITLIGEVLAPGIFGGLPHDPAIWVVRAVGAALLILGIFRLRKAT